MKFLQTTTTTTTTARGNGKERVRKIFPFLFKSNIVKVFEYQSCHNLMYRFSTAVTFNKDVCKNTLKTDYEHNILLY